MSSKHEEYIETEKFISLVKRNKEIYNYKCSAHKKKDYIDSLWQEIANEMQTTIAACKAKWLTLRNSYCREIRNEYRCFPHIRKRKWYLSDEMDFLREYLNYGHKKKRKTNKLKNKIEINDPGEQNEDYNDDGDGQNDFEDETLSSSIVEEQPEVKYNITKEELHIQESYPSQSINFDSIQPTPSFLPATISEMNPINELSRSTTSNHRAEQQWAFFKSILPDILKLSERRQRKFKQQVMSALYNSLDEQDEEERGS